MVAITLPGTLTTDYQRTRSSAHYFVHTRHPGAPACRTFLRTWSSIAIRQTQTCLAETHASFIHELENNTSNTYLSIHQYSYIATTQAAGLSYSPVPIELSVCLHCKQGLSLHPVLSHSFFHPSIILQLLQLSQCQVLFPRFGSPCASISQIARPGTRLPSRSPACCERSHCAPESVLENRQSLC